jgi:hypothetical protein
MMKNLSTIRVQVLNMGRCAVVGALVGMLSTQAFASGLDLSSTAPSQPASALSAAALAPAVPTAQPAGFSSSSRLNIDSLPAAPEVAMAEAPASLDPAVAAAVQDGSSLTSAPKSTTKRVKRPGMLILGIAGIAPMALGAYFYSYPTKNTSLKDKYGTMLFVPGAAMSAVGFYFAFK